MNSQEIFDTVVNHAFKQGHRATGRYGRCFFRAPGGDKCFIGAVIPDELYTPEIEDMTFLGIFEKYPEIGDLFECPLNLVIDLQEAHDKRDTLSEGTLLETWDARFVKIADKHQLTYRRRFFRGLAT